MIKYYKNAAFTILISIFMINIATSLLISYLYEQNKGGDGYQDFWILSVLTGISVFLLILGIFFTVMSVVKKEKKDYKFIISVAGYTFLILMNVVMMF